MHAADDVSPRPVEASPEGAEPPGDEPQAAAPAAASQRLGWVDPARSLDLSELIGQLKAQRQAERGPPAPHELEALCQRVSQVAAAQFARQPPAVDPAPTIQPSSASTPDGKPQPG